MTDRPPPDAVPIEQRRPTPLYRWLSARLLRLERWVRSHGSANIRWGTRVAWALVVATGLLLLFGPVINKPLDFDDITASTEDATATWIARSFDADYELHRTADGRLQVEVTERITAFFPDAVADEKIERVIPTQYQSHELRPTVTSATLDGAVVDVHRRQSAEGVAFELPHSSSFAGDHDIVLRYTLHDLAYPTHDAATGNTEQLLEWNVFGPAFAHGVGHSEMRITVPRELVDAYSRQPRGGIAWLLVSDSSRLEPDAQTADTVTYAVANDQNMPPYTTFWFRFPFQPDTFTLPAPSFLYWLQVIGPFVPLLLLAATLLLSLAARAVAWSDARGRAWYVYREDPPDGVSPAVAARVWRAVLTAPLVGALQRYRSSRSTAHKRGLVRAADHAGRLGNLLFAWTRYLSGSAWRAQFDQGLRRVPRGFVRDSFIGAALAWTVLQWGLVRQLSYQVPSEFWWPAAIVAVTTILALIVLVITLSARPLTREGALVKEQLLGLRLYTQQTQAAGRTTLRDRLLPYIVMFSSARTAGRVMRELVAREGLSGDVAADPSFVTGRRLAIRVAAVLAVPAAIAVAVWVPASTHRAADDAVYSGNEIAGDYGLFIRDFRADGILSTADDGALRLEAQEHLHGTVQDGFRDVPQVLRQWHDTVAGHRMRLTVTAVTVDGAAVRFVQERIQGQALLRTMIGDEWPGEHDIVIRYTIDDPVAEVWADGRWQQRLRWTALNPGWRFGWSGVDLETEKVAMSLTLPAELAGALTDGSGWLSGGRWPDTGVRTFGESGSAGGGIRYSQRFAPDDEGSWPAFDTADGYFAPEYDFLGAQLHFPEGTFSAGGRAAFILDATVRALPIALPVLSALGAIGVGLIGIVRRRRLTPTARDATRWLTPGLTGATCILMFWATRDMTGDEPVFALLLAGGLLSLAATVWTLIATRTQRARTRT